MDQFTWYKNIHDGETRHRLLSGEWTRNLPFFLTGVAPRGMESDAAPAEVINGVENLVAWLSGYTQEDAAVSMDSLEYPPVLEEYFNGLGDPGLSEFNLQLKRLYEAASSNSLDELLEVYQTSSIRRLWGTPYHYFCFFKRFPAGRPSAVR